MVNGKQALSYIKDLLLVGRTKKMVTETIDLILKDYLEDHRQNYEVEIPIKVNYPLKWISCTVNLSDDKK